MLEQGVPYPCTEARRSFCREVLRRDRADETDHPQGDQHKAHAYDIGCVLPCNAHIDHRRHHKRDQELKGSLQHLEQRRKDGFFLIIFQIYQQ